MSQIATHILDTAQGKPVKGVEVNLLKLVNDQWLPIGSGVTNSDGRIADLLEPDILVEFGRYRLDFLLERYFFDQNLPCLYPEINVVFMVSDQTHYHIPLLLSPFGYSTYRGS